MRSRTTAAVVFGGVVVLAATVAFLFGQRAASGQSASSLSSGAVPRMPDGKPSLEGIWQALNTAAWDIQDHSGRFGVPAGQGVVEGNEIPYQDWALAKKKENFENRATAGSGSEMLHAWRAAPDLHAVSVSNRAVRRSAT